MKYIIQMKKHLALFFLFFISTFAFSQAPGEWTWMGGDSLVNQLPVFGTQGLPAALNHPPGVYEACEWTDLQGNFWVYGGMSTPFGQSGDLWKYDPLINQWAWMNGPGIPDQLPVYGIKGVAAAGNYPGARAWGVCTWTDLSGNLWMYGNFKNSMGVMADLWMYDISSNQWTWMSGQNGFNFTGNFGTQGIPSSTNSPPGINETSVTWVDSLNNLWFFGGADLAVNHDDVWKYSVGTYEWTWMKGSGNAGAAPVYGIKGVSNPANTPGGRLVYSRWMENNNNFWIFGGWDGMTEYRNDMWRYTISTNEWTWMAGTNAVNDTGITNDSICIYSALNVPAAVIESRACWKDSKNNFIMHSGIGNSGLLDIMWSFKTTTLEFGIIRSESYNPHYGVKGVGAPANSPGGRGGACSFKDQNGYLWMFGGISSQGYSCDFWRFVPDTNCGQNTFPNACFSPVDSSICPGTCINFNNCSVAATTYVWSFSGGSPSTSTDEFPSGICYSTPGNYDVSLTATNASGSSTYSCTACITVYPSPPPQGIAQGGDTLFANPGAVSYQWYFNANSIPGATNYYYVAPSSGDYNVVATDANGCEVEAVIFNVIATVSPISLRGGQGVKLFPNPVDDELEILNLENGIAFDIAIYNLLGVKVYQTADCKLPVIDCRFLQPGLYWIEITNDSRTFRASFVKE